MEETEGAILNGRSQRLHTYAYLPERPHSILIFHHGFGEYSGRQGMPEVFRTWAKAGIAVHTFDAHGHGLSEPHDEQDRHLIWDFNDIVDDLLLFAHLTRKEYTKQMPMFLGGHSMGSLASIHAALRDQAAWDGLVLGTATVDVEWNWVLRCQASVGSILAQLIPRAKIVPASVDDSPEIVEPKIPVDPLLCATNVRCRTANELLKAFNHVQLRGHLLWLPIYCHHGTADKLASINAIRNLLARCASPDITFHEVPEGPHELFLSQQSILVTSFISEWIQSQLEAEASNRLPASPLKNYGSLVSLTGNPFDWRPQGGSPLGSVYGGSPRGCSPVESPRFAFAGKSPFSDSPLVQHA